MKWHFQSVTQWLDNHQLALLRSAKISGTSLTWYPIFFPLSNLTLTIFHVKFNYRSNIMTKKQHYKDLRLILNLFLLNILNKENQVTAATVQRQLFTSVFSPPPYNCKPRNIKAGWLADLCHFLLNGSSRFCFSTFSIQLLFHRDLLVERVEWCTYLPIYLPTYLPIGHRFHFPPPL